MSWWRFLYIRIRSDLANRIETQDELLQRQEVSRMIEIGPSDTLISMAKKTLSYKYLEHDATLPRPRTLQSFEKDAKLILHEAPVQASDSKPPLNKERQAQFATYARDLGFVSPSLDRRTMRLGTTQLDPVEIEPEPPELVSNVADVPCEARWGRPTEDSFDCDI